MIFIQGLDFFNKWLTSQKDFTDNWIEGMTKMQSAFMPGGKTSKESANEAVNTYNSWIKTIGIFFDEPFKKYPLGKGSTIFEKITEPSDLYSKLNDLTASLFKAVQDKSQDFKKFMDIAHSEEYKAIIDKLFDFASPDVMSDFYSQTLKIAENRMSSSKNFLTPWAEAIQKNTEAIPYLMTGNPAVGLSIFQNIYNAFESTMTMAFQRDANGEERDKFALIVKTLEKNAEFLTKNTEFQKSIYQTAQKAFEKVLESLNKKVSEGTQVNDGGELLSLWKDINISEFDTLFSSKDFSGIQTALLEMVLDTRKHFQKFMETIAEDFQGSENKLMDDVYASIKEMGARVSEIEKRFCKNPV